MQTVLLALLMLVLVLPVAEAQAVTRGSCRRACASTARHCTAPTQLRGPCAGVLKRLRVCARRFEHFVCDIGASTTTSTTLVEATTTTTTTSTTTSTTTTASMTLPDITGAYDAMYHQSSTCGCRAQGEWWENPPDCGPPTFSGRMDAVGFDADGGFTLDIANTPPFGRATCRGGWQPSPEEDCWEDDFGNVHCYRENVLLAACSNGFFVIASGVGPLRPPGASWTVDVYDDSPGFSCINSWRATLVPMADVPAD